MQVSSSRIGPRHVTISSPFPEASDIRRLREVEAENSKLRPMFANLALENRELKDLIEKKL